MIRTPEEQYLHELIESYIAPLRSEIKELRQQLDTEPVKNNGVLPIVRSCHAGAYNLCLASEAIILGVKCNKKGKCDFQHDYA